MSDNIPPEIIRSILARLPVKSVLCFRSVSKEWRSLIDGHEFIKLHLEQSTQTTSLIAAGLGKLFSIDFNTLHEANEIKNPFGYSTVLGSCNGVLLLRGFGSNGNKLTLLNPTTRTHRLLPDQAHLTLSGWLYVGAFGIGFDYKNNDFKVVSVMEYKAANVVYRETKIFSLRLGYWKTMKDFPYAFPVKRVWGVPINSALHTVVTPIPDSDWPKAILATDLALEDYRLMELPASLNAERLTEITLDKLGEFLSLLSINRGLKTEIWVMKKYGVAESWTKLFSLGAPFVKTLASLGTLCFSKDGYKVLLYYNNSKFVWYDLKAEKLIDISVSGLPLHFCADVCVGNLFRLGSSNKNQQRQEESNSSNNNNNNNNNNNSKT